MRNGLGARPIGGHAPFSQHEFAQQVQRFYKTKYRVYNKRSTFARSGFDFVAIRKVGQRFCNKRSTFVCLTGAYCHALFSHPNGTHAPTVTRADIVADASSAEFALRYRFPDRLMQRRVTCCAETEALMCRHREASRACVPEQDWLVRLHRRFAVTDGRGKKRSVAGRRRFKPCFFFRVETSARRLRRLTGFMRGRPCPNGRRVPFTEPEGAKRAFDTGNSKC